MTIPLNDFNHYTEAMTYVRGGFPAFTDKRVYEAKIAKSGSYRLNVSVVDGNVVVKDNQYNNFVSFEPVDTVRGAIDMSRTVCAGEVEASDIDVGFSFVARHADFSTFRGDDLVLGGAFNAEGATFGTFQADGLSTRYSFYAPGATFDQLDLEVDTGQDLDFSDGEAGSARISGDVERYALLRDLEVEEDLSLDGLGVSSGEPQRHNRRGIVADGLTVGGIARFDVDEVYGDVLLRDADVGELHLFDAPIHGTVDLSGATIGRIIDSTAAPYTIVYDENTEIESYYRYDRTLNTWF